MLARKLPMLPMYKLPTKLTIINVKKILYKQDIQNI